VVELVANFCRAAAPQGAAKPQKQCRNGPSGHNCWFGGAWRLDVSERSQCQTGLFDESERALTQFVEFFGGDVFLAVAVASVDAVKDARRLEVVESHVVVESAQVPTGEPTVML